MILQTENTLHLPRKMKKVEITHVEDQLTKNGKAKVECIYLGSKAHETQRGLCADSNVRVGEIWEENGVTNIGWLILGRKAPLEEQLMDIPTLEFEFIGIKSYKEVIGLTNVVIEFEGKEGAYYMYPLKSKCICIEGGLKIFSNPSLDSQVSVYKLKG